MQKDSRTGRMTVLLEELAYANLILAEALSELLCEKGMITAAEVKERVGKLRKETKLNFHRSSDDTTSPVSAFFFVLEPAFAHKEGT